MLLLFLFLLLFWLSSFNPSRNLYDLFTYNHMALMSLRSLFMFSKAFMILTRIEYLFIHIDIWIYIRSLLNIILTSILTSRLFYFVYITECIIHQLIDIGPAGSISFSFTMSRLPDYNIRCQFQFGSPTVPRKTQSLLSYRHANVRYISVYLFIWMIFPISI